MKQIITSLLDLDLYKLTMHMAVLHHFPKTHVEYEFKCRNDIDLLPYKNEIEQEIDSLCELKFEQYELEYLKELPFIKSDYIDFLEDFKLKRRHVYVYENDGKLGISVRGAWVQTILFETLILSIVNEVYFRNIADNMDMLIATGRLHLREKITFLEKGNVNGFKFADFGTRRRFSKEWQKEILETIIGHDKVGGYLVGTSNVLWAFKLKLKPIGTMAHEWLCAGQALTRVADSQKFMLQKWADEYRGDLGIALSDTLGFDKFLKDFDMYFAKLFDGCRHDSGDPYDWCKNLIRHYEKMNIDPKTKSAVFSDGLNFTKAIDLYNAFSDKINVSFGIGTNLTNDMGLEPLQIVMKMVECNGKPVAKISDSPGKGMCKDDGYLDYLRSVTK